MAQQHTWKPFVDLDRHPRTEETFGAFASTGQRGLEGEQQAASYLLRCGHRLIGHRVQTPFCEVDFLTSKDDEVWLVEVKSMPEVGYRQQQRLARAYNWLTFSCELNVRSMLLVVQRVTRSDAIEEIPDFLG